MRLSVFVQGERNRPEVDLAKAAPIRSIKMNTTNANFEAIETTISETVKGKDGKGERKEIGKVTFLAPTLAEFSTVFADAETTRDEKTKELSYVNPKLQWLYSAVVAAARAILTSKLEPKSTSFKSGHSAWVDFDSMIATSGLRGQALAIRRDFIVSFTAYIAKLGKSEKWSSAMVGFASKPQALASTTTGNKAVFSAKLDEYEKTLGDADKAKFLNIMLELTKVASGDEIDLEDDTEETE
jgi:hypothetical protein